MTGKRRSEVCRFVLATAVALLCAAPASSQAPQVPAATRTVNLTLEQRHVIRELVRELKVSSTDDDLKLAAGDKLPREVALVPVPPLLGQKVPQIKSHSLYITKNQVLIVDPQEQRVVDVIE
jgi:hypothetical protein